MTRAGRPKPIILPPLRAKPKRQHQTKGWYWQIVLQGRRGRVVWSGYGTSSTIAGELAELVQSGAFGPDAKSDSIGPVTTVRDLLETWMASEVDARVEKEAITDSTRGVYERTSKQILSHLGTTILLALDQDTLDRYDLDRIREGASPSTVVLERITLGAAWNWGVRQGQCPNRRLPRTQAKPRERDVYVPSRVEVARILAHVRSPWHRMALRIQAAIGARASEVGHLRIRDVDHESGVIRIWESKTDKREVPVAPQVLAEIKDFVDDHRADKKGDDPLLMDTPPLNTAPALNNALHRAAELAELAYWSTHSLRYRAVVDLIDAGVDPKTACEITGHSMETMLKIYRKVSTTGKRQAIQLAKLGYLPDVTGTVVDFKTGRKR